MKKLALVSLLLLGANSWAADKEQVVTIEVTEKGYQPNMIEVKPGIPVVLQITRKTDSTCATDVQIPAKKIKEKLPLNKMVTIKVGKLEKGEIKFGCGMNMMDSGMIHVK